MALKLEGIDRLTKQAVRHYWSTLDKQQTRQQRGSVADRGRRAAVTGGRQMDGFCDLVQQVLVQNGVPAPQIYVKSTEIPGYFRPTKEWDMLVVVDGALLAALEFKSQRGSFGNNFNNRAEEAIGTANDLWTAYREGALGRERPWVGWVMLLEDSAKSRDPVGVSEPHFKVFPEFRDASYAKRYEILVRRLVLEKLYDSAALLLSTEKGGAHGDYSEPAADLAMSRFVANLAGRVASYVATR